MRQYFSIVIFVIIFLRIAKAQESNQTSCETPNKKRGFCINILSCKMVVDILSKHVIPDDELSYVKSLLCGYQDDRQLVCCPSYTATTGTSTLLEEEKKKEEGKIYNEDINNNLPNCGIPNDSVSFPKILGRFPAKPDHFPWIAALGYRYPDDPNRIIWKCEGSLITTKHVLTAAQCISGKEAFLHVVRLGGLDFESHNDYGADFSIASWKIHEGFDNLKRVNDIAIITLSTSAESLPGTNVICLPWDQRNKNYTNYKPMLAGWGQEHIRGPFTTALRFTSAGVVDNSICFDAYAPELTEINEKMICARPAFCLGDSGGPLMLADRNESNKIRKFGRFTIIGIVSHGVGCASAKHQGVYTRVSSFLAWIKKNLI